MNPVFLVVVLCVVTLATVWLCRPKSKPSTWPSLGAVLLLLAVLVILHYVLKGFNGTGV